MEIVSVPSFSPAATTFPLPIYHTTTTMSREALRPRNLNVNYLPPPPILSSPPSSPKNVKKQSAKHRIMDNHSGPKCTSSNHLHHLQWSSTNLALYLMCLHPLLKLHLQCSTLMIIIAPQTKHMGQSQLVTRPSSIRKHSKIQFRVGQIFLSFPHSLLHKLLSILKKQGTNCLSRSPS